jgi:hypothetical protein
MHITEGTAPGAGEWTHLRRYLAVADYAIPQGRSALKVSARLYTGTRIGPFNCLALGFRALAAHTKAGRQDFESQ